MKVRTYRVVSSLVLAAVAGLTGCKSPPPKVIIPPPPYSTMTVPYSMMVPTQQLTVFVVPDGVQVKGGASATLAGVASGYDPKYNPQYQWEWSKTPVAEDISTNLISWKDLVI